MFGPHCNRRLRARTCLSQWMRKAPGTLVSCESHSQNRLYNFSTLDFSDESLVMERDVPHCSFSGNRPGQK